MPFVHEGVWRQLICAKLAWIENHCNKSTAQLKIMSISLIAQQQLKFLKKTFVFPDSFYLRWVNYKLIELRDFTLDSFN